MANERTFTFTKDEITALLFFVRKALPHIHRAHAARLMIGTAIVQLDKASTELNRAEVGNKQ